MCAATHNRAGDIRGARVTSWREAPLTRKHSAGFILFYFLLYLLGVGRRWAADGNGSRKKKSKKGNNNIKKNAKI